jgi:ATP-dependent DNA helicase RecQ
MADFSSQMIRRIIDRMIEAGVLLVGGGEFPVVTIGNAGPILKEEQRLLVETPKEEIKQESTPTKPKDTKKKAPCPTKPEPVIDNALLDMLKKLRREMAGSAPAYIVFPDASLMDMCYKKPTSLKDFSGISGVGQVKLEKYGDAFTSLIRDYLANKKDPGSETT